MDVMDIGGMNLFPVYDTQGRIVGTQSYEILERYEKRVIDGSNNKWFPHVTTEQRVKVQAFTTNQDGKTELVGDPFEGWIVLEEESVLLPFRESP